MENFSLGGRSRPMSDPNKLTGSGCKYEEPTVACNNVDMFLCVETRPGSEAAGQPSTGDSPAALSCYTQTSFGPILDLGPMRLAQCRGVHSSVLDWTLLRLPHAQSNNRLTLLVLASPRYWSPWLQLSRKPSRCASSTPCHLRSQPRPHIGQRFPNSSEAGNSLGAHWLL
jgi:hypothetical protein